MLSTLSAPDHDMWKTAQYPTPANSWSRTQQTHLYGHGCVSRLNAKFGKVNESYWKGWCSVRKRAEGGSEWDNRSYVADYRTEKIFCGPEFCIRWEKFPGLRYMYILHNCIFHNVLWHPQRFVWQSSKYQVSLVIAVCGSWLCNSYNSRSVLCNLSPA